MKTTQKFFGTIALVLIAQFVLAVTPAKTDLSQATKLRKEIISQLAFPKQIQQANGKKVSVYFEVNENYKIDICKIETEDAEIEKFVRKQFEEMNLSGKEYQSNIIYKIDIKFNLKGNN